MFALSFLTPAACWAFEPPKVIVLQRLHEFEPHLRGAAEELKLNVEFHAAHPAPHYLMKLAPKFESASALVSYRKVTGRPEDTRLELREAATGRVLVAHEFRIGTDESSRRTCARDFIEKLHKELRRTESVGVQFRD